MARSISIFLLLLLLALPSLAQQPEAGFKPFGDPKPIPEWYQKEMARNIGFWVADNSAYQSPDEPFEEFRLEWHWAPGKMGIEGELYGMQNGRRTPTFWRFIQYWDPARGEVHIEQIGIMGGIGKGYLERLDDTHFRMNQWFQFAGGDYFMDVHHISVMEGYDLLTNYRLNEEGKWQEDRTYKWVRRNPYDLPISERIQTRIDTLPSGQVSVLQEFVVDAPRGKVWAAFTQAESARQWMAPLLAFDLRNGGSIQANARKGGQIGDDQTATIQIVHVSPGKLLTTQIPLHMRWTDISPEESANIFITVVLEDEAHRRTRVSTWGTGYLADPRFARAIDYHIRGNEGAYAKLIRYLESKGE